MGRRSWSRTARPTSASRARRRAGRRRCHRCCARHAWRSRPARRARSTGRPTARARRRGRRSSCSSRSRARARAAPASTPTIVAASGIRRPVAGPRLAARRRVRGAGAARRCWPTRTSSSPRRAGAGARRAGSAASLAARPRTGAPSPRRAARSGDFGAAGALAVASRGARLATMARVPPTVGCRTACARDLDVVVGAPRVRCARRAAVVTGLARGGICRPLRLERSARDAIRSRSLPHGRRSCCSTASSRSASGAASS